MNTNHHNNTINTPLVRLSLLIFVIVMMIFTVATIAEGQTGPSIRLHDQAHVDGDKVRLRNVADLQGSAAEVLGDTLIATLSPKERETTVTINAVRNALTDHSVNWGMVTLRGYARCLVRRAVDEPTSTTTPGPPVIANPIEEVGLDSAITLRDRVIQIIEQYAQVNRQQLRITFNKKDGDTLALNTWEDRYEFEPLAAAPYGRVPIVIRRYRDGRLVQTYRVTADVVRRYMAVTVVNSMGRGQTFAPGDVEIREVFLDNNADKPITNLSQVIGQTAGSVLRTGSAVFAQHLRSPLMVRRGELVTVRFISGNLVVKTVGRATEDGVMDQMIQMRNNRSRDTYLARVTGPQQAMATDSGPAGTSVANTPRHHSGRKP